MGEGPNFEQERALRRQGYRVLAGVDEVGRGAWAGPVVACAAILPLNSLEDALLGIRDSKQLTAQRRQQFFDLLDSLAVGIGVGLVSSSGIDQLGIAPATRLAMRRAVDDLSVAPEYLLVDGFPLSHRGLPQKAIVGGDAKCASIAAASVVAKVVRDDFMATLDGVYLGYGFGRHKGYGTEEHRDALSRKGPCAIHRQSYSPIRILLEQQPTPSRETGAVSGTAGVGRLGEKLAAEHLDRKGYVVCEMNYRCGAGEMDVVALDGKCLVFVEVRTRRSGKYGTPEESITASKKQKLVEVAQTFLQEHGSPEMDWRIDVASVRLSRDDKVQELTLIKNAIEG
jgi:ribonuclease HII